MKWCVWFMLCWITFLGKAQQANVFSGSVIHSENGLSIWNLIRYPALLCEQERNEIGIYGENRFCSGLNVYQMGLHLNIYNAPVLFLYTQTGTTSLQQQQFSFNYGKRLHPDMGIAFSVRYNHQFAKGYSSQQSINGGLGLFFNCSQHCRIAIQADGIESMVHERSLTPYIVKCSLGYLFSKVCSVSIETQKEQDRPLIVNGLIFYDFLDKMYAAVGVSTGTPIFTIGVGYLLQHFRLGLGTSFHPLLGTSTGLSFVYTVNPIK